NAFEGMVDAPAGHLDDDLLHWRLVLARIDAVGGAELARQVELGRVGVDGDDASGLRLARALDHRQTDAAEAEHRHRVAFLHLRRIVHGADAGGDTATQPTYLFWIGLRVHLRQRNLGDDGVFAEGR